MSGSEIQRLEQQIYRTEHEQRGLRVRLKEVDSPPPPASDPEHELKGYVWPSSRITRADMIRLTELRSILRKPITKLLHEAVAEYYRVLMQDKEGTPRCCDRPRLRWKSESASNCYVECSSCGFVLCDDGQLADWHDPAEIAAEQELAFQEALEDPSEGTGLEGPVPGGHLQGKREPARGKPQVSLSRIELFQAVHAE